MVVGQVKVEAWDCGGLRFGQVGERLLVLSVAEQVPRWTSGLVTRKEKPYYKVDKLRVRDTSANGSTWTANVVF